MLDKMKERINCWIADYEDNSLLKESLKTEVDVKNYLIDEAKQIFDTIVDEGKKFSLTNKKNAKKFTIKRKNYDEAKHWLINHLDLSEEWTIKEIK